MSGSQGKHPAILPPPGLPSSRHPQDNSEPEELLEDEPPQLIVNIQTTIQDERNRAKIRVPDVFKGERGGFKTFLN
jgi:hypothetical protein